MEENNVKLSAKIEALLFVHGEAMKIKRIAEVLGTDDGAVKAGLDELKQTLNSAERGIVLITLDNTAMLATRPELAETVKKLVSDELDSELSPASLETLSIVAYLGPISRAEIDYIRGVNSSFILRNLQIRGLVSRDGTNYSVTFDFMKHIGVSSLEELPEFNKYREVVARFKGGSESPQTTAPAPENDQNQS